MPAWDDPALEALDAARSLEGFGIELPQPAAEWVTKLAELRQQRPQPLPTHHVAGLIADSVDEAVIDRAVASHVGHHFRVQQHAQAERICGQRALAAILADRDRIHDELRTTAEALIDRLHRAAAIDEDIRELTRQRRTDEAHLLATADADIAELVADCVISHPFGRAVARRPSLRGYCANKGSRPARGATPTRRSGATSTI